MSDPAQSPPSGAGEPRGRFGADLPLRAAAGVTLMAAALIAAWTGGFLFLAFWLLASAMVLWEWQKLIGGERLPARLAIGRADARRGLAFRLARLGEGGARRARRRGRPHGGLSRAPSRARASGRAPASFTPGRSWRVPSCCAGAPLTACPRSSGCTRSSGAADIMAYFGGRLIGGPKLWPRVSPGKTWSGAVVGALAGALCGAVVGLLAAPSGARFVPILLPRARRLGRRGVGRSLRIRGQTAVPR